MASNAESTSECPSSDDEFKFTTTLSLEDVRQQQSAFAAERGWGKFHKPRNLVLAMVGEIGELSEIFQWRGHVPKGLSEDWSVDHKDHLGEELSDVLIYLVSLANCCRVDFPVAILRKIELNKKKFPVDSSSGNPDQSEHEVKGKVCDSSQNDEFTFSTNLSLEEIREIQTRFAAERGWGKFNLPRNLLLGAIGVVGRIAELFQWRGEVENGLLDWSVDDKDRLGEELSDLLIYLVRLAQSCHIDFPVAVVRKFELNKKKYVADVVYGSSLKYSHYLKKKN